jgi:hypothetical protein
VGDYDPSGLHMSEVDIPTRLAHYARFYPHFSASRGEGA